MFKNFSVTPSVRFYVNICNKKERLMIQGTVKWFNPTKGYGFIQPDNGGNDVFVHITAVQEAGLKSLDEGQKIGFEVDQSRGKPSAEKLKPL
jgi:CspA family cold shock protein